MRHIINKHFLDLQTLQKDICIKSIDCKVTENKSHAVSSTHCPNAKSNKSSSRVNEYFKSKDN